VRACGFVWVTGSYVVLQIGLSGAAYFSLDVAEINLKYKNVEQYKEEGVDAMSL